jgi:hypothetical protein
MKHYLQKLSLFSVAGLVLASACTKENKVFYNGGTAPVLTASNKTDTISLPIADSSNPVVSYFWTNPNFQFSTGPSSLSVTYYLQFDTLGAGFGSQYMQSVAFSTSLTASYTISTLNELLANGLQLDTSQYHNVQVRVAAFIPPYTSGSTIDAILYSDTLNFVVKPYIPPPAVTPPIDGASKNDSLYIVGSAIATTGWDNPIPPAYIAAQTFTRITDKHFQITIPLIGGGEYKLVSLNGSWTDQWSVATQDQYPNGGPFVYNGNNCIAPATSGTYLIDVNFQTGLFTVTAQ